MQLKKKTIVLLGLLAIAVIWAVSGYNSLVKLDENVTAAWGTVEADYQRRLDLIPKIAQSVKSFAEHEKGTLESVMAARSKATSVTIDPTNITEEDLAKFQEVQSGISGALKSLLAVSEAYPTLKADALYADLIRSLEGTENRIKTSRVDFNEAAKEFNMKLRTFPNNILGGFFGFSAKPYFKAESGAEKAPDLPL